MKILRCRRHCPQKCHDKQLYLKALLHTGTSHSIEMLKKKKNSYYQEQPHFSSHRSVILVILITSNSDTFMSSVVSAALCVSALTAWLRRGQAPVWGPFAAHWGFTEIEDTILTQIHFFIVLRPCFHVVTWVCLVNRSPLVIGSTPVTTYTTRVVSIWIAKRFLFFSKENKTKHKNSEKKNFLPFCQ